MFNQEKFIDIVFSLANEYSTFDKKIKDPQRLFRLPLTVHQKTGLYKVPVDPDVLPDLDAKDLKEQAKEITERHWGIFDSWKKVEALPQSLNELKFNDKPEQTESKLEDPESLYLDMSKKPNWLSEARYVLQEGYFKKGNRNEAMMILASTYRLNGFDKDQAAALLDVVADKQAAINDEVRKSSDEIKREILDVVYSSLWKGGVYSEETNALLQETIQKYGLKKFKDIDNNPRFIDNIGDRFKDFVKNLDKNTIKTGIKSLDQNLFLTTGTNVGLLGAPGSGKTSLALNILNNTSKQGIKSVFVSLDMSSTRLFEKVCYKVTGLNREQLYKKFENDEDNEIMEKIHKEFGNVYFMDKAATSVEDIEKYIDQCERDCGEKIKLVLIDYFERVNCHESSDDFAASKKVASKIQDLVNSRNICAITLLQPNKFSGDLSTPILSYSNIKGTSFLAQSFRIILSIYREGFSPEGSDNDSFLTLNVLKNDLGETKKLDFHWNGRKGEISELDHLGRQELEQLRNKLTKKNEDFEF
jgi:replicative DNA helicase